MSLKIKLVLIFCMILLVSNVVVGESLVEFAQRMEGSYGCIAAVTFDEDMPVTVQEDEALLRASDYFAKKCFRLNDDVGVNEFKKYRLHGVRFDFSLENKAVVAYCPDWDHCSYTESSGPVDPDDPSDQSDGDWGGPLEDSDADYVFSVDDETEPSDVAPSPPDKTPTQQVSAPGALSFGSGGDVGVGLNVKDWTNFLMSEMEDQIIPELGMVKPPASIFADGSVTNIDIQLKNGQILHYSFEIDLENKKLINIRSMSHDDPDMRTYMTEKAIREMFYSTDFDATLTSLEGSGDVRYEENMVVVSREKGEIIAKGVARQSKKYMKKFGKKYADARGLVLPGDLAPSSGATPTGTGVATVVVLPGGGTDEFCSGIEPSDVGYYNVGDDLLELSLGDFIVLSLNGRGKRCFVDEEISNVETFTGWLNGMKSPGDYVALVEESGKKSFSLFQVDNLGRVSGVKPIYLGSIGDVKTVGGYRFELKQEQDIMGGSVNVFSVGKIKNICDNFAPNYECRFYKGFSEDQIRTFVQGGSIMSDQECMSQGTKCCYQQSYYCTFVGESTDEKAPRRTLEDLPGAEDILRDPPTGLTYDDVNKRTFDGAISNEALLEQARMYKKLAELRRIHEGTVSLIEEKTIRRVPIEREPEPEPEQEYDEDGEPVTSPIEFEEPDFDNIQTSGDCKGFPGNFVNFKGNKYIRCSTYKGKCCMLPHVKAKLDSMKIDKDFIDNLEVNGYGSLKVISAGRSEKTQSRAFMRYLGGGDTACGPKFSVSRGSIRRKVSAYISSTPGLSNSSKSARLTAVKSWLKTTEGSKYKDKIEDLKSYKHCLHPQGYAIDVQPAKKLGKVKTDIDEQNKYRRMMCDHGWINWLGEYWHYVFGGSDWKKSLGLGRCVYGNVNRDFNHGFGDDVVKYPVELDKWDITKPGAFGVKEAVTCSSCQSGGKTCSRSACDYISGKIGNSCVWKPIKSDKFFNKAFGREGKCIRKKDAWVIEVDKPAGSGDFIFSIPENLGNVDDEKTYSTRFKKIGDVKFGEIDDDGWYILLTYESEVYKFYAFRVDDEKLVSGTKQELGVAENKIYKIVLERDGDQVTFRSFRARSFGNSFVVNLGEEQEVHVSEFEGGLSGTSTSGPFDDADADYVFDVDDGTDPGPGSTGGPDPTSILTGGDSEPWIIVAEGNALEATKVKWLSALDSKGVTGRTWIGKLESNGPGDNFNMPAEGRETIIFVPQETNLNQPFEIMYFFHGIYGFDVDMEERLAPQIEYMVNNQNRNFVLVFPELPWSAGTNKEPRRALSRQKTLLRKNDDEGIDLLELQSEVKVILAQKFGMIQDQSSFISMTGHSAGGAVLWWAAQSGDLNRINPHKITFSDSDYYGATQLVWDKLVSKNFGYELNLLVLPPGRTGAAALPTENAVRFITREFGNKDFTQQHYLGNRVNYVPVTVDHVTLGRISLAWLSGRPPSEGRIPLRDFASAPEPVVPPADTGADVEEMDFAPEGFDDGDPDLREFQMEVGDAVKLAGVVSFVGHVNNWGAADPGDYLLYSGNNVGANMLVFTRIKVQPGLPWIHQRVDVEPMETFSYDTPHGIYEIYSDFGDPAIHGADRNPVYIKMIQ